MVFNAAYGLSIVYCKDTSIFHDFADANASQNSAKAAGIHQADFCIFVQIWRTWLLTGLVGLMKQR